MVKKFLVLVLLLGTLPCFASGVGYINYDKVIENYQYAKNTIREIEIKSADIQKYLEIKEAEFEKIESALQKKKFEETVRTELSSKEKALNIYREKKEDEIYNNIHALTEKIRLEQGLDTILDSRSVFSGGVDITDKLILLLNSEPQRKQN
jgi:Skp family chaperone for outer membrane proteins